ncbi:MAG: radical SAM protein [Candidatus Izemoplasmataceae bacterium]
MENNHYVYGPISSRRLGQSLGISPMLKKTCNYNCIYCQLGHTHFLTNRFNHFVDVEVILKEIDAVLKTGIEFDTISIAGNGEPTLYDALEALIDGIKSKTTKPLAIITNGALLYEERVKKALLKCDIVLPSINGYDPLSHIKINRPHKALDFKKVSQALIDFSREFKGELWLEIMLMKSINDSDQALKGYLKLLENINYDKLYLNVPVRPPSEKHIEIPTDDCIQKFANKLNAIPIHQLASPEYKSTIAEDYEALISILKHHPLNQFEIIAFLKARNADDGDVFNTLDQDSNIECIHYKNLKTYRYK